MAKRTATLASASELDQATRLRIAVARISRRLQRATADAPLTTSEIAVLSTAARVGPVGLGRLAAIEGINPTMLSRVVRTLEQSGLLERQEDPDDRRAAHVAITPEGHRLVERVRTEKSDALSRALDRLDDVQRGAIIDVLPALEALAEDLREEDR